MFTIIYTGKIIYLSFIIVLILFIVLKRDNFASVSVILSIILYFLRLFILNYFSLWLLFFSIYNLFLINIFYYHIKKNISVLWNIIFGCLFFILIIIELLGFSDRIYYLLFLSFTSIVVHFPAFKLFSIFYYKSERKILIVFLSLMFFSTFTAILDLFVYFILKMYFYFNFWISFLIIGCFFYMLITIKPDGFFNILKDADLIMRLERTEKKLIRYNRQMISSIRIAGIVHEFKNIISNIKLNAEYGLKENAEKDTCLKLIMNNTKTGMESVIKNLECIGFIEEKNMKHINLDKTILKIIRIVKSNYSNIRFEYNGQNNIFIKAFQIDIEHVFINIIRNSIGSIKKNRIKNSTIRINTFINTNLVIIYIKDNAGGVPFKVRSILFKPPYECKIKKGMGLYLSKKLIIKNNGALDFYPLKKGSCFRIIFKAVFI